VPANVRAIVVSYLMSGEDRSMSRSAIRLSFEAKVGRKLPWPPQAGGLRLAKQA